MKVAVGWNSVAVTFAMPPDSDEKFRQSQILMAPSNSPPFKSYSGRSNGCENAHVGRIIGATVGLNLPLSAYTLRDRSCVNVPLFKL